MKIVNVTPGLLPIPPNGWGAVEKIIWETHLALNSLGHTSEILYLDDIKSPSTYDVIHIHVANLANIAYERGIPYYFTMHDHHSFLYGKDSFAYKENLEAIKHAKKAFVPAKFLIDYFDGIPQYFSHGVNCDFFTPKLNNSDHKLLCVANNGFIHNQSEDRKGFGYAIDVAKHFDLPITIAGPNGNKNYFDINPSNYEKLVTLYNLSEEELRNLYQEHTIFLHPSILEAGHPNLTLLEALASGLPVVGTFEPNNTLNGMVVVDRDVNTIINGVETVINNYLSFKEYALKQANELKWVNRVKELISVYKESSNMKNELINNYINTKKTPIKSKPYKPSININNIDGAFIEIKGNKDSNYDVEFKNINNNNIEYSAKLAINSWAKVSIKYFVDWLITVKENDNLVYEYNTNYNGKTVYIALDSKSLGDTLAWFPYVDEFRKKHNCKIICSTFWNHLFENTYSELRFIKPGETAFNIDAMYTIGLFYDSNKNADYFKHPNNPIEIPLQKIASDILGLEYNEIKPKLSIKSKIDKIRENPYVVIGFHSTAQLKYWNNPTGWEDVCEFLLSKGVEPIIISKEGNSYMGNTYPKNATSIIPSSIEHAIDLINGSQFFMGISSGLSWLSWALNKKTVLISGFTDTNLEFQDCIRIINKSVCNGCWGRHKFDPTNWNWCPEQDEFTAKQFECSKQISSESVINQIRPLLN